LDSISWESFDTSATTAIGNELAWLTACASNWHQSRIAPTTEVRLDCYRIYPNYLD